MTAQDSELETRIDKAISTLDVAGKVRLLMGAALFSLWPEPAVGLPELRLSDGPTGVRGLEFTAGDIACLLPNATLLSQSWDAEVAAEVGGLLAEEAQARRVHVVLGPTINLHRTPLGGRLFEAFSEDPLLTGVLAAAYVNAMQAGGVGATPKHFLANESETARNTVDSVVDQKTLREVYLLPFEIAVSEATPWAIMASYNKINGVTATEHHTLIEGVLKGEWGYDGVVVSDWFATTSTDASANGGLDLAMPGPDGPWGEKLVAAVKSGEVAESVIDEHLRRLLRLAGRVGAFTGTGQDRAWPTDLPAPDSQHRRDQLRRLAASGMTVLVNRDHVLPLAADLPKLVLIGKHATETIGQGGGSAQVRAPHVISIADGLATALGVDRVSIAEGVEVRDGAVAPKPGLLRDPETGKPGLRVVTRDAKGAVLESNHIDVTEVIAGFGNGWIDAAASVELTAEVALDARTRLRVGVRGQGDWTFTGPDGATHSAKLPGGDGPGASLLRPPFWAEEIEVRPGARLSATVRDVTDVSLLGLVAAPATRSPAEVIAAAAAAAEDAELAVVVVGLTQEQETEGVDKSTLVLPGEQDAMVAAVAAVARHTVVVVNAATPVLMPWLNQVDAVLLAGLPGQEAGAAVAAALLGEIEPAGRLVTTFPAHDGDGPAWSVTPVDGALPYTEGTAVGYRGWSKTGAPQPRFWFGHGLGYTDWTYTAASLTANETVASVSVELTNSGPREGREVVQVYLRPADPAEPVRLIGWAGARLAPGETTTVPVACDPRVQRVWTEQGWQPLAGAEVLIARGLGDIRVTLPVKEAD